MSTIADLEGLGVSPHTSLGWLDSFDGEARARVVASIIEHRPAQLWPILSNLDVNPYPLKRSSFSAFCKKVKEGEIQ